MLFPETMVKHFGPCRSNNEFNLTLCCLLHLSVVELSVSLGEANQDNLKVCTLHGVSTLTVQLKTSFVVVVCFVLKTSDEHNLTAQHYN